MANAGRGQVGLRKGSQIGKEVQALSDEAKRRKRLEANVAAGQKRIRQGKKVKPALSKTVQIRQIQQRASRLRARASKAEKAGHKKAATIYREGATKILQRASALRAKR